MNYIWQAVTLLKKTNNSDKKKSYSNNNKNCATVWRALPKIEIIKITLRIVSESNKNKKSLTRNNESYDMSGSEMVPHIYKYFGLSLTMSFGSTRTTKTTRKYDVTPCSLPSVIITIIITKDRQSPSLSLFLFGQPHIAHPNYISNRNDHASALTHIWRTLLTRYDRPKNCVYQWFGKFVLIRRIFLYRTRIIPKNFANTWQNRENIEEERYRGQFCVLFNDQT